MPTWFTSRVYLQLGPGDFSRRCHLAKTKASSKDERVGMLGAEQAAGVPCTGCTQHWRESDEPMQRQVAAAAGAAGGTRTSSSQHRDAGLEVAQRRAEENPGWARRAEPSPGDVFI